MLAMLRSHTLTKVVGTQQQPIDPKLFLDQEGHVGGEGAFVVFEKADHLPGDA